MTIYLIYIIICISILIFRDKVNNGPISMYLMLFWVLLFTFRAEDYGLDIKTYYNIFLDASYYTLEEPLLNLLNALIGLFSEELIWFNFCYAFIMNAALLWLYSISTKHKFFALFLFSTTFVFFQLNLNIYRQGLANILSMIILIYSFKKNQKLSVLLFAPIFIHKSSIFFLANYFFCLLKLGRKMVLLIIATAFLPISDWLISIIISVSVNIFPLLSNSLAEYQRVSSIGLVGESGLDHRNIPVIFAAIIIYIYHHRFFSNKVYSTLSSILLFSLLMASAFQNNVLLYDRIILPAQLLSVIFIIEFICFKFRTTKVYLITLLCVFSSLITVFLWGPRNFLDSYKLLPFY